MKKHCILVLVFLVLLSSCTKQPEAREANVIISDIVNLYAKNPDQSEEQLSTLFEELNAADSEKAVLWTHIIDFWKELDAAPVNENSLPAGLPGDDSLALVVLGYQLAPDGSMRDELLGRLQVALRCSEQYPNAYVLCTGGGTASEAPEKTEAGEMGKWLAEQGVSENRILIEDHSLSTAENALYSYGILKAHAPSVHSLVIISSSYHIVWGSVLFESVLLKNQIIEKESDAIHVISNAAYPFENEHFPNTRDILRSQLLSIID